MAQKRDIEVPLWSDENVDSWASPVVHARNVEMAPGGDSLFGRRGSQVVGVVACPPSGQSAIVNLSSNPPNLTDGTYLATVAASDGIQSMAFFRPRTNIYGDVMPSTFNFDRWMYAVDYGAKLIGNVIRTGDLSTSQSVTVTSTDGSAVAGVDFVAISTTLTFAVGEFSKSFTIESIPATKAGLQVASLSLTGATGKYSYGNRSTVPLWVMDTVVVNAWGDSWPVQQGDPIPLTTYSVHENTVLGTHITGFPNFSTWTAFPAMMRVGPDLIMVLSVEQGAVDKWGAAFYSLSALRVNSDDPLQALEPAFTLSLFEDSTGLFNSFSGWYVYDEQYTYLVTNTSLIEIDAINMTSTVYAMPMVPVDTDMVAPMGVCVTQGTWSGVGDYKQGLVDRDGYLILRYDSADFNHFKIAAIDPVSRTIAKSTPALSGGTPSLLGPFVSITGGGYALHDYSAGNGYVISADMQTVTQKNVPDGASLISNCQSKSDCVLGSDTSFNKHAWNVTLASGFTSAWTTGASAGSVAASGAFVDRGSGQTQVIFDRSNGSATGGWRTVYLANSVTGATVQSVANDYAPFTILYNMSSWAINNDCTWYSPRYVAGRRPR